MGVTALKSMLSKDPCKKDLWVGWGGGRKKGRGGYMVLISVSVNVCVVWCEDDACTVRGTGELGGYNFDVG